MTHKQNTAEVLSEEQGEDQNKMSSPTRKVQQIHQGKNIKAGGLDRVEVYLPIN